MKAEHKGKRNWQNISLTKINYINQSWQISLTISKLKPMNLRHWERELFLKWMKWFYLVRFCCSCNINFLKKEKEKKNPNKKECTTSCTKWKQSTEEGVIYCTVNFTYTAVKGFIEQRNLLFIKRCWLVSQKRKICFSNCF